ncbi:hypothetical protein PLESTB_000981800 [Pleodorina starrii]|uniref:Ribonuclease H n=1 Tax=Pleodorina starrii TaxID=330485 RepID=A0A9W6BPX9_9CHLO|nr:hypothetical protein PLESTB_000981800 [Pleodorina starrii]GLC73782.1 hypothetical protein PLESTF_001420600 [Pleodorina starrii]
MTCKLGLANPPSGTASTRAPIRSLEGAGAARSRGMLGPPSFWLSIALTVPSRAAWRARTGQVVKSSLEAGSIGRTCLAIAPTLRGPAALDALVGHPPHRRHLFSVGLLLYNNPSGFSVWAVGSSNGAHRSHSAVFAAAMEGAGAGGDEENSDSDRKDESGDGGGGGGKGGRRSRRRAGPFYAVAVGRKTGVFRTWDEAEPSVRGFSGAVYKKFSTEAEARVFVQSRAPPADAPAGGDGDGATTSAAAVAPTAPNPQSPSGHVGPFYAVARGYKVGVFATWAEAQEAIKGASGAMYRRFNTRMEAEGFLQQYRLPPKRARGAGAAAAAPAPAGDSAPAPAPAARKRGRPKKADSAAAATVSFAGADAPGSTTQRGESDSGAGGADGVQAAAAQVEGEGEVGEVAEVGAAAPSSAAEPSAGAVPYGPQWQSSAPVYYAVARGKQVGIFTSWPDAQAAVEGVSYARFKRFKSLPDAYAYLAAWAASELPAPAVSPAGKLPAGGSAGDAGAGSSGSGADSGGANWEFMAGGAGGGGGCHDDAVGVRPGSAAEAVRSDVPERRGGGQRQQQQQGEEVGGDAVHEEGADGDRSQLLHFGSLSGEVDPALKYRLEFDGGSRRNPGDAGFGAVLVEAASGRHVEYVAGPLAGSSNNVAEWSALAAGMQVAVDMGVRHLVVQGDSELVCRQVSGRYGVNTAALQPLAARVSRLRSGLESFEVVHVPRAQNAAADLLSNYAMDAEEAVAAVVGEGVDVAPSLTEDDDEEEDGRVRQRDLLRPTMQALGEAALQTARAAVAASAAAALSDSVLSAREVAATSAAVNGGRALGRGAGRGARADVVVTECRPPLAARGSAAGSLQEFNRALIALACAGHSLLD